MDNKKNGIPKLRFPGFTGAWEQRKLGDIAVIFDGTHQTPKYTDSGIKFVSVENIATLETEKYISQKAYENEYSNKQAEKGDILMTRIGNIGTAKIIEKDEPLAYYVTLALLKPQNIDSNFLVWGISSPEVQRNIWKLTLHIAFPKKINLGEINQVTINIPSSSEQKKIGEFFQQLDSLIALHQRKLEHLQEQKKGLLQKMFPKNGEVVPEVRFPGFTDAWEQRKLGEVVERRIEKRRQSERYPRLAFASGQGVIPLSERKTNNREQLTKDEFTKKYLVTELDDIVYNPANVKYGAIDRNKYGRGLISPIYVTFTTGEVPGFIERIVKSHDFKQKALRFEEGTVTKRQSVNPEDLVTINILVASQKKEQKKISLFFDNIDTLIALHQRKLEHLELMKKGLLQQMFV